MAIRSPIGMFCPKPLRLSPIPWSRLTTAAYGTHVTLTRIFVLPDTCPVGSADPALQCCCQVVSCPKGASVGTWSTQEKLAREWAFLWVGGSPLDAPSHNRQAHS